MIRIKTNEGESHHPPSTSGRNKSGACEFIFSGEARHAGIQRISITGDAGFLILSVPEAPVSHRQPTFGTPEERA
jgi:hypothetical protein